MNINEPLKKSEITAFVIRILFWSLTLWFLVQCEKKGDPTINGIVLGVIAGDIITWIIVTALIELPKSLAAPSLDIVINIVILYLIINVFGLQWPEDFESQGIAFLALLGTAAFKFFTFFAYFFTGEEQ